MNNLIRSFFEIGVEKIKVDCFNRSKINFEELTTYLEFPSEWKENEFFETEIKKSFLRGYIREKFCFKNEIDEIVKKSIWYKKIKNNINYITKTYPIIHLPNDRSEVDKNNQMHSDQLGKDRLITIWIPITQYNYPGISYTKGGRLINTLTKNFNYEIRKRFVHDINVNENHAYIWYGNLPHKGNLNTSDKISSAAIFWLTKDKIHDSKSVPVIEYLNTKSKILEANIDLKSTFDEYKKIINLITKVDNPDDLKKISVFINKSLNEKKDYEKNLICFSLSLLGQRCENKEIFRKEAINFHYIANKIGNENMHSAKFLETIDLSNKY